MTKVVTPPFKAGDVATAPSGGQWVRSSVGLWHHRPTDVCAPFKDSQIEVLAFQVTREESDTPAFFVAIASCYECMQDPGITHIVARIGGVYTQAQVRSALESLNGSVGKAEYELAMKGPARIWLQWNGDEEPDGGMPDIASVTWASTRVFDHDVEYVRADDVAAENERLRKALEPFAKFAAKADMVTDGHIITQGSLLARRQLTMGDCKAAVRALKEKPGERGRG